MAASFYKWVHDVGVWFSASAGVDRIMLAEEFDMLTQEPDPLVTTVRKHYLGEALRTRSDEEFSLDFADFLLAKLAEYDEGDWLAQLDAILTKSGSEWTVGQRGAFAALEKRVPDGVRAAADLAMNGSASAGNLLSEAWHAAFGRSPDSEEAYEKAIKAVEEASAAVVLPNNPKATLGTIASTMRDQKNWRLPLEEDTNNPSAEVVVNMVRALWSGQESRHGGNSYRKPTQQEAESAVLLAVPLVQWFTRGTVARRS
ncbi:MAG TPA: hypothetical protein VGP24_04655 [Glaciihabitans sp.]|nr:hypothetical protein [Glaciihabitans sp.]